MTRKTASKTTSKTQDDGCKLVGYYRVSTEKQGQSGLGLEGQIEAVRRHAELTGCKLVATFIEVETGKRSDRPELLKAIAHARRAGATLVIAKLDRLARNMAFTANLMESGVDFVACDNPHANRLTIHILAAVAEDEARRISERTKAGLAALKARGVKLGADRAGSFLTEADRAKGRAMGREAQRVAAVAEVADLVPLMVARQKEGCNLRQIAAWLNEEGHTTRTGAGWSQVQVKRALNRAGVSTQRD
jgi:DNA invertase Pin-like site-specific DNA recombinase